MSKRIFVTRQIPENGIKKLQDKGYEVDVRSKNYPISKKELIKTIKKGKYDAVLSLLTDTVDAEVMDASATVKIFANYAVGFNNFDIEASKSRGITLTNTPGGSTERVAEHTMSLLLALACRIAESDSFVRKGKYTGWDPMIFWGTEITGKTLGIVGAGRIGTRVAEMAKKGFNMNIVYADLVRNERIENELGAKFVPALHALLAESDYVSLHVPLTPETTHMIGESELLAMKDDAVLINTARGPVIDEVALVDFLKKGKIAGAGLDVFEFEPKLAKGLNKLPNVILTPHIASATESARCDMSAMAADNIIAFFEGKVPPNKVN